MATQTDERFTGVVVCLCTAPNDDVASKIAEHLVAEDLAACVNQVAGVKSTYRWEGEICEDNEVQLIIKARADQLTDIEAAIKALHPYQMPEFIVLPVVAGSIDYVNWITGDGNNN